MQRLVAVIVLLWPLTAVAQETSADGAPATGALVWLDALRSASSSQQASNALAQGRPPSPPPTDPGRRRPSMVGYVDDSTVESQVRVRFDSGFHIDTPDRAEFFYAKCGCYRGLPQANAAFDPNAAGPGPAVLTDLNFQELRLRGEYAVHNRVSGFVDVPLRWLQPQAFAPGSGSFSDQSGLGDARAGVKVALLASEDSHLTAQFQAWMPSGKALNGLGTNHWSVEPSLLYYQALSDRLALESEIGDVHPTNGSAGVPTSSPDKFAGDVLYYGVGPSFQVYQGDGLQFGPIVELVGWHVLGGFQTAAVSNASGINIVNLKVGGRATFGGGSSVYVGYGHALTTADWYNNIIRIEFRRTF
jgi:hypothetical protein